MTETWVDFLCCLHFAPETAGGEAPKMNSLCPKQLNVKLLPGLP